MFSSSKGKTPHSMAYKITPQLHTSTSGPAYHRLWMTCTATLLGQQHRMDVFNNKKENPSARKKPNRREKQTWNFCFEKVRMGSNSNVMCDLLLEPHNLDFHNLSWEIGHPAWCCSARNQQSSLSSDLGRATSSRVLGHDAPLGARGNTLPRQWSVLANKQTQKPSPLSPSATTSKSVEQFCWHLYRG